MINLIYLIYYYCYLFIFIFILILNNFYFKNKKDKLKHLKTIIDNVFSVDCKIIIDNNGRIIILDLKINQELNNIFFLFGTNKTDNDLKEFLSKKQNEKEWYSSDNVLFYGIDSLRDLGIPVSNIDGGNKK